MRLLVYSALLALCGFGVLVYGQGTALTCLSRQHTLIQQQNYIRGQLLRFQLELNALRTVCRLNIANIFNGFPYPPSNPNPPYLYPTPRWPTLRPPIGPGFPIDPSNPGNTRPTVGTPGYPTIHPTNPTEKIGPTWQPGTPEPGSPTRPPSIDWPVIPRPNSPLTLPPQMKLDINVTVISNKPLLEYILTPPDIIIDANLTTVQLIIKYGYPVETHFVTTQDNYILCLHRIPRPGAPVILLVHGLMSSSAIWVQMGPSFGLAYKLYMQGYDVWMLNTRGNRYSKAHKIHKITDTNYWLFSFHEIGVYDLPATIDMIISITKQPQIQYIGHSQGSTAFFVMCSELPQYNAKIIYMQALSPTVFLQNTKSPVLKFLSLFKGKFGVLMNLLGGLEISRNNNLIAQFRNHICSADRGSQICSLFDYVMCGFGWSEFNVNLTQLVVGHSSQGASSVQIYHYAQLLGGMQFHRFDKGSLFNQKIYLDSHPPQYNLTMVTCKVSLHYSEDDWLAGSKDVENLKNLLPNCIDNSYIVQKDFSHYDYMLSQNVNRLVYSRLLNNVGAHRVVALPATHVVYQRPVGLNYN